MGSPWDDRHKQLSTVPGTERVWQVLVLSLGLLKGNFLSKTALKKTLFQTFLRLKQIYG